jgi:hypothetical protein
VEYLSIAVLTSTMCYYYGIIFMRGGSVIVNENINATSNNFNAPSKLKISVAFCCMTKLNISEWPFIVPSTRCTCVMKMLFI